MFVEARTIFRFCVLPLLLLTCPFHLYFFLHVFIQSKRISSRQIDHTVVERVQTGNGNASTHSSKGLLPATCSVGVDIGQLLFKMGSRVTRRMVTKVRNIASLLIRDG